MASYRLTTPAAADYVEILDFTLERWGMDQYQKYGLLLDHTFQKLADTPNLGMNKPELLPREILLYRIGSHRIGYRKVRNNIEILRILHVRRELKPELFGNS